MMLNGEEVKVGDATRQMAIDANAQLRAQLLAALDREDDGRTSLSTYVSHLVAQRDALKASLSKADDEIERLHELRRVAAVWRAQFEKPVKLPRMAALIEAVDKLTEGAPSRTGTIMKLSDTARRPAPAELSWKPGKDRAGA